MQVIALSLVFCLAAPVWGAKVETPITVLADLASALSQGDPDDAMAVFDKSIKDYEQIETNIEALAEQTDILCAIDIVTDNESAGVHKLDVDWFMQLKTAANSETLERRRERVNIEMRQISGKWKITALSPLKILDPIRIQ